MSWENVFIYDRFGTLQDKNWLLNKWGDIVLWSGTKPGWTLVRVEEQYGPASCVVKALSPDGTPVHDQQIAWNYSTAPENTGCTPGKNGWPPGMVPFRCDVGGSNPNGDVGFALSGDSWYSPALGQIGPYATWLCGASDVVLGLGMLVDTDGPTDHAHLNLVFMWEDPISPPPEPPPGEFEEAVLDYLALITQQLAELRDMLEKGWIVKGA